MPHERFFTGQRLEKDQRVTLEANEFHHLCHVMRARVGDRVDLVNGQYQLAHACLLSMTKHNAELQIVEVTEIKESPQLILAQALPRFNRLEYILEKGTELGVTDFWLFPGLLSEKERATPSQQSRMQQLCIAAMKQCGRLDLPRLCFKPPLLEWESCPGTPFFGDTCAEAPYLWQDVKQALKGNPMVLFIGPEKGFAPRETAHLREQLRARGVRLHPHILRVDTAPLVGLSLIQVLTHCQ